ncbi:chitinase [Mucilaginibacter ginkgonis]|uniref:Glycoside hydrolase family 19 catalytic domain-containing protein n=1 Tax=Mucilaginibacter ginkgonis TaxID=2682091 RepID=A0A6I4I314_9SPHI|nr:chitinase [Mucilaginibacter ginkgonis]QQL48356.1 hypothetical protein GO620_009130 [Mucilaginibacter ginkgonis]
MTFLKKIRINTFLLAGLLVMTNISCGNASQEQHKAATQKKRSSFSTLISEKQFNELFPLRDKFYTYAAFIKAADQLANISVKVTRRAVSVYQLVRTDRSAGKTAIVRQDADWNEAWAKAKPDSTYTINYGDFCTTGDATTNKRELAAFFAQIAHETRHGQNGAYNDGLMLIDENNTSLAYIGESDDYPPVAGQKYYGRGPMQISYNGNYGYASDCIFGDEKVLLNNPALVETDPVVAFKTAIYFWLTPQTHKPSAHDVMSGKWKPSAYDTSKGRKPGFGMVINIVNGGVECNHGEDVYNMKDRIGFYQYFLGKLGVSDPNCVCSCGTMQPYE